jgi:putative membrane protein
VLILAHADRALAPHDLWGAWSSEPGVLVGVALATLLYLRGRRAGPRTGVDRRAWCFAGGLVAVLIALASPLDALSGALASAHMVQHVILVSVAAPLLALSAPGVTLLRGAPLAVRRATGRWRQRLGLRPPVVHTLANPVTAWLLHAGFLWVWHAAVLYDAALANPVVHAVEHGTFLASALLFWRVVAGPEGRGRVAPGLGVLMVFGMTLQSVFLSVLLTFARQPWYAGYATTTESWGLTHLADQQLAGVIMWVPAGVIYVGAGLALLVTWIGSSEDELPAVG